MKRDFVIADTKHGRRLLMVDPAETKQMVDAGHARHVRGNMYATKVMRADVAAPAEVLEPVPLNGAEKESFKQPPKKRGRPPLKKAG